MKKRFVMIFIFIILMFLCIDTLFAFETDIPGMNFGSHGSTCVEIIGPTLSQIIKYSFNLLRIIGAIIAIVNGSVYVLNAVYSNDSDALNKAIKKCIKMAVILVVIGVFPTIINLIGKLFEFDVSCIF